MSIKWEYLINSNTKTNYGNIKMRVGHEYI